MTTTSIPEHLQIAFIGGGNMASAILGGLVRQGMAPARIRVVEPFADTRARLQQEFGVLKVVKVFEIVPESALGSTTTVPAPVQSTAPATGTSTTTP